MSADARPVPGLDFTAIDFETANGFRGSPCAVGAVRVRDGRIVQGRLWLMRPPAGFDRFDPRNQRIHGIAAEDVAEAPRFGSVFDELAAFLGDDVLAAHNAGFDVGVIESALEVSDRDVPALDYACTLTLARRAYDLASYALPSAAAEAGHPLVDHHDALADARACAAILIDVARRALHEDAGASAGGAASGAAGLDVAAVLARHGIGLGHLSARERAGGEESRPTRQARGMVGLFDSRVPLRTTDAMPDFMRWPHEGTNPPANRAADVHHPLFGHTVVFTGGIGMSRQDAKNRAAEFGAQPASRVTGQTSMVVVGDGFRAEDLEAAAGPSGAAAGTTAAEASPALGHRKVREAIARRDRGQRIAFVAEPEFLQMLGANWPAQGL